MKNKPYKEVNTWKRHSVEVVFINVEDEVEQEITEENLFILNTLKQWGVNMENIKLNELEKIISNQPKYKRQPCINCEFKLICVR